MRDRLMDKEHIIFDRPLMLRRKERFAATASQHSFLLENAAQDIADRVRIMNRQFPTTLNVGAFNGLLGRLIREIPGCNQVVYVESSPALLRQAPGPCVLADDEALPFKDACADMVVTALALQNVNDLPGALIQIRRALKPDGLFLGALLGGETLRELREAWLAAETEIEGGVSPRVHPFTDVRDAGSLLQRAGFALPVADSDRLTVTYPNAIALMNEIRAMGTSNALIARRRKPVTRRLLARAAAIYHERFSEPSGRVRATFEIITLTAWVPHESQQKPLPPGSAKVRLAEALGRVEHRLPRQEKP